jgi:hypothetical protein
MAGRRDQPDPGGLQPLRDDAREPPGEFVPEDGIGLAAGPYRPPSNSKASTGLAATAPKAHLYGGNSHDQPSSLPMPMVSRPHIEEALRTIDDTISQIRDSTFAEQKDHGPPAGPSRCRLST